MFIVYEYQSIESPFRSDINIAHLTERRLTKCMRSINISRLTALDELVRKVVMLCTAILTSEVSQRSFSCCILTHSFYSRLQTQRLQT